MIRNTNVMLRVGLKYCGACNPEYDRVALVEQIERSLQGKVAFVSTKIEGIDIILAVQGCSTACADLSAFQGLEIRTITKIGDTDKFIDEMNKRVIKHGSEEVLL